MDMQALFFPQNNDVVVTAQFPDISDGTGMSSEFYYKLSKTTPDDDPSTLMFTSTVDADPDNVGATMAQFPIPGTDNGSPAAYWWRVDVIDTFGNRRTTNCGPLLVESV
jgi:hypothetical protein